MTKKKQFQDKYKMYMGIFGWVSEWFKSAIYQLYHAENKLYINEMDDDVGFAQYQHA